MNNTVIEKSGVADQAVRDELLNPNHSFIVQAPAGSGKTELLTQRILTLLARVDKPESILAITFTRKAAQEMRERVLDALKLAKKPEPLSAHEKNRWQLARQVLLADEKHQWHLLKNPSRLNLTTIDSLSSSLTAALPMTSQTGTLPSIEESAFPLYQRAAESLLKTIDGSSDENENLQRLLIHKNNHAEQVRDLLAELLAKRMQWVERFDGHSGILDLDQLVESMIIVIEDKLEDVYAKIPVNVLSELPALVEQASSVVKRNAEHSGKPKDALSNLTALVECPNLMRPGYEDLTTWKAIAELMLTSSQSKPAFRKAVNKTCGFPASSDDAQNEDEFQQFKTNAQTMKGILKSLVKIDGLADDLNAIRKLPSNVESNAENPILRAVVGLLPQAIAHLKLIFRETNQIDFSEVNIAALNALSIDGTPTDIALTMDYRIEHLLVDEFQDTSYPQVRLIELLTAGWDGSSNKTLFLVGDPMQSIYRFRDANVSLFMRTIEQGIGQIQPKFRQLTVNFRSKQGIIAWVNRQFGDIMPKDNDLTMSAVKYSPSIAFNRSENEGTVYCYCTVDQVSDEDESNKILEIVRQHLNENSKMGNNESKKSLAILARNRKHFSGIVSKLNQNNITYQAVEIESLSNKTLVTDIKSLALALCDQFDMLSWTACLRSPWFSLSLSDINQIISLSHARSQSIPRVIGGLLEKYLCEKYQCEKNKCEKNQCTNESSISKDGLVRIQTIYPILAAAIRQKGKKPFIKWLAGCFEAIGGHLSIDFSSEYQDLNVCIETINEFVDGGEILDREGLNAAIDKLFAAPNPEADDQIQIMTIHKSKGLEFDRVILPRLDARSQNVDTPLLKWAEVVDKQGQKQLLLSVSKEAGKEADATYQFISYLDKQKEIFEAQRLLYVAATRAKSELYLMANLNTDEKKKQKSMDENMSANMTGSLEPIKPPISSSFFAMLWLNVQDEIHYLKSNNRVNNTVDIARNEQALSQQTQLHGVQDELAYLFPERMIKRVNISQLENAPLVSSQTNQAKVVDTNCAEFSGDKLASAAGTLLHQQLEWLANYPIHQNHLPEHWEATTKKRLKQLHLSISAEELENYSKRITCAIKNMLNDEMGQFILKHRDSSQSEFEVSVKISAHQYQKRIIDRTFIEDNVRWIVDYKSSAPEPEESDVDFIRREVRQYKTQLKEYVALFKRMEKTKIVAGLYFPVIAHFEPVIEV